MLGKQRITNLLQRDDCTVSLLAHFSQIRCLFTEQHQGLIDYLKKNINDVLSYALGEKQPDSDIVRQNCLFFLTTSCPLFQSKMKDKNFLTHIHNFIMSNYNGCESIVAPALQILSNLIKSGDGMIFANYEKLDDLLSLLVKNIKAPVYYSFLYSIAQLQQQDIFIKSKITEKIFMKIGDDEEVNWMALEILTNFAINGYSNSPLITYFFDESKLEAILNIALNSRNKRVSASSFNFLLELSSLCDEDDSTFKISTFVIGKIDRICGFVKDSEIFNESIESAVRLLLHSLCLCESDDFPDLFYEIVVKLFNDMFKFPFHSILHCTVLSLLQVTIDKSKKIFEIINIREKISGAFINRENINNAMYYGHLIEITNLVIKSGYKFKDKNQKWDNYLSGEFAKMSQIIDKQCETENDDAEFYNEYDLVHTENSGYLYERELELNSDDCDDDQQFDDFEFSSLRIHA